MYNYLSPKTADYQTTTLSFGLENTMPQKGNKSQVLHEFDDGSITVVGLSSNSYFDVSINLGYVSTTDKATIMDFWHNSAKADGMRRTFYWDHPTDEHTYTVRFMSELEIDYVNINIDIPSITLRVEGNKPA